MMGVAWATSAALLDAFACFALLNIRTSTRVRSVGIFATATILIVEYLAVRNFGPADSLYDRTMPLIIAATAAVVTLVAVWNRRRASRQRS